MSVSADDASSLHTSADISSVSIEQEGEDSTPSEAPTAPSNVRTRRAGGYRKWRTELNNDLNLADDIQQGK